MHLVRQQPTPGPSSSRKLPDPVRLTRNDQSVVVMEDAVVSGDSIVGYAGREQARTAVALSDVQSMKDRYTNYVATIVVAAVATVTAMFLSVTRSDTADGASRPTRSRG